MPSGVQGGLVAHVRNVGAAEPGGQVCQAESKANTQLTQHGHRYAKTLVHRVRTYARFSVIVIFAWFIDITVS